jgi:indolepyruvate ferredoxin oxidoreductase
MSLQKVATEFGPKTRIHASSCNQDYSCLKGDCPAFVTVQTSPGTGYRLPQAPSLSGSALPEPGRAPATEPFHLYMPGVGGTGVLTLNGILSVAALLDGYRVLSYDQTGAAQKWGPVISSLVLAPAGTTLYANKVGAGRADVYLALDMVGAASPGNLDRCSPGRTKAVTNTDLFPTGEQVRDVYTEIDEAALAAAIAGRCAETMEVPARRIAEELFGDYMLTNLVVLGAAYQAGLIPIAAAAIEEAIGLNGVAVDANRQAFRHGRMWVHDRAGIAALLDPPALDAAAEHDRRRDALGRRRRSAYDRLWHLASGLDEETRRLLAVRLAELVDYQDERYARAYLDTVAAVADREQNVMPGTRDLTHAVARCLYKLMAGKDEYEVARLYLKSSFRGQVAGTFTKPVKVSYNLHPPFARRLGINRKLTLGPWFRVAFHGLRAARRLRGTVFDPFARQAGRREEREILAWYRDVLQQIISELRPADHAVAVRLGELPDLIRGYEQVRHNGAETAKAAAADLLEQLHRPRLPIQATGR